MKRRWLMTQPPAIAGKKGVDRPVAAAVVHVDQNGHETLEITLCRNHIPVARYFADVNEGIRWSYVGGKWTKASLDGVSVMSRGLTPCAWYCNEYTWDTPTDRQIVEEYLGTYSVSSWECSCNEEDRKKRENSRRRKIQKEMEKVPMLDYDGMEAWAEASFFPEYYLFTWPEGDRNKYQCTCCGKSSWRKERFKARSVIKCPKCGHEVIVKKQIKEKEKYVFVTVLQMAEDRWVERLLKCVCRWDTEKTIDFHEQIRIVMKEGEHFGKVYWGEYNDADEFGQEFWDKKISSFSCSRQSYLYPGTLDGVLPFAGLEHSGMDILANQLVKADFNNYIQIFESRRYIEYLIKRGLINLAADMINHYYVLKMGHLEIDGNRINRLKAMNGGWNTYTWLRYEEQKQGRIPQEVLEFLSDAKIVPDDVEKILDAGVSITRMANYLRKQDEGPKKALQFWKDYLSMAAEEGMDINDDIVRMPKDLRTRHDMLVEIRNARKDEERLRADRKKYAALDASIASHIREAARYYWQNDEYMIVPAAKCEELMEEGRKLHHCVGSSTTYMRNMAEGRSWILFLRKKEDLEKPYYTVEVKMDDDKIIQFYSEFDRQPDKEKIKAVLDKMVRAARMQRNENRVRVPLMAAAT